MEDADDEACLKEDERAGKAAGHPLTMQLHFALQNKNHGHHRAKVPQQRIKNVAYVAGKKGGISGIQMGEFEIMHVDAHGSANQSAANIKTPEDAMHFGKALPQAIRELQRAQDQCASGGQ